MNIYEITDGAPNALQAREEREKRTYQFLRELDIPYLRADHDAAFAIGNCDEIDKKLDVHMCKNLFLCNSQKTVFYLVMLPGEKKFSSKDFAKKMCIARVSFAPEEYLEKHLGVLPGAVSVLGLMNDKSGNVTLVTDKSVADAEYIGCHPCVNTSSLKIKTSDVFEKFLPATEHKAIILEL